MPNALVLRDLEGIARISNISCVSIGAPKNRFLRIHANTREGSARKWLRVTLSDTDRCGGLLCPPDRPCPRQRQVNGLLALRYPSAHVPFKDNSRIEQDHATAAEVRQAAFVAAADKLTPVEVTWGPEFFEGVSQAGAEVYAGTKTPQEAADWLENVKFKGRKPVE